jgi:hypothetical protein
MTTMKPIFTSAILLLASALLAQPVFEYTYDESATICQLENLGEIYYSMDVVNKRCLIYNMDHSLLKSIALPTPEGYYLADIQHVSETLFNDDNLLELVYIYSKYVPTETSYFYTFRTKLINEQGTILLTLPDGVGYTEVLETTEHGKKFLAYEYDYSVIPYRTYTHVYSLPESATKSVNRQNEQPDAYAWPNPSSSQVHIPVALPDGVKTGSLVITDTGGRGLFTYPVSSVDNHVLLPARQFSPGTYLYHVVAGGSIISEPRKMIIR